MATGTVLNGTSGSRGDTKFRGASAQGGQVIVYKYVSDSISAAGNSELDLASAGNWTWGCVKVHQLVVKASASTDFDLELYPDDNFTANTHYYKNENNNLVMNDKPLSGLFITDLDETNELHLKLINTDAGNASTFTVYVIFSPIANF